MGERKHGGVHGCSLCEHVEDITLEATMPVDCGQESSLSGLLHGEHPKTPQAESIVPLPVIYVPRIEQKDG